MHKMVNGERVELTIQEEQEMQLEWAKLNIDSENLKALREVRNNIIAKTDYLFLTDGPKIDLTEMAKYRQELRDITKLYKSLTDVVWPTQPKV